MTEDEAKARQSVREAMQQLLGPRLQLAETAKACGEDCVQRRVQSPEPVAVKRAKAAAKSKAS